MFYNVAAGLYLCGLVSATTGSDYIVARVGHNVTISLNTSQAGQEYKVGVEVNLTEFLFLKTDTELNIVHNSHTWYRDRDIPANITPSEFRFTLYNVTTEDAGLYECRTFDTNKGIPGCDQLLVVAQKPSQPSITGSTSADSGGRVTLTCSSSSQSLPPRTTL
ncbi:uncharacterized protein LOC124255093 [Haliotis rubra]|uniref:uncharacterized protein LOC124255093 n=1 Tax=Haliotis rubra TaxID=36100 RepID=UPI001EE5DC74|nr:uncharacterized protein LOC124255093 [Haliotis rubra]